MTIIYLLIGLCAGLFMGLLGVGGGIIMIPALVYLLDIGQHRAQGTVLAAMLLPVGLLAVMEYYRSGNVDLKMAGFIALGLLIGGYGGAILAGFVPDQLLRRIFGGFMLIMAVNMLMGK